MAPGWYRVYYGTTSGQYTNWYDGDPTIIGGSSATISGLTTGNTYHFAVRYFVSPGASNASPMSMEVAVKE